MSTEEEERAKFQKSISKASTTELQRGLDEDLFVREWKVDMVEAEVQRRLASGRLQSASSASNSPNHKAASMKSWALTIFLIFLVLLGAAAFVLERL